MAYYIKVRPYVAQRLGVEAERYRYADGNYLIWDKELSRIDNGWVFHPAETVARIGGLMMDPYRNKEEQAKTAQECTLLPEPTDPEWMAPEGSRAAEEEAVKEFVEAVVEGVGGGEVGFAGDEGPEGFPEGSDGEEGGDR